MFGLLVYDLRRLFPYLSMAVVAAAISALHVGIVGIVFPMIGAAWAVNGLSASDRQNGWAAFAVSSGIGRRDFVRARFSALMVFRYRWRSSLWHAPWSWIRDSSTSPLPD